MKSVELNLQKNDGEEIAIVVRSPNHKDISAAKIYSNKIATKLMKDVDEDGKPTFILREQLKDILRKCGQWSEEKEKQSIKLSKKINELEKVFARGGIKKSEAKKKAIELIKLRNEQLELFFDLNQLDEKTIEAQSENAYFDYLVTACSFDSNGDKLFDTVDEYKELSLVEDYCFYVGKALQEIIYGKIEDMISDRPETKFLKKYNYMNDKLQYIDEKGNVVDENGKSVVTNEEEIKFEEFLDG